MSVKDVRDVPLKASASEGAALTPSARSPMALSPKTPLSVLSKTLQARAGFRKLRGAPSEGFETPADKLKVLEHNRKLTMSYWRILVITAICSSTLSFSIDQVTFVIGMFRNQFTNLSSGTDLVGVTAFNVLMVVAARLIVRTTVEAEGSGFPEMKAMLFGHVLDTYLTMRVLVVKAVALSLSVGAGMPIGKEGPNCHMAACIARSLDPDFMKKRSQSAVGQAQISKLLLAACAVGVGATFGAPIGGVIFALELMLPQIYDFTSYWGCFVAAVVGALTYEVWRTWLAGATGLLPLLSSNVLPGEGATTRYPVLRMLLDVMLGAICGFLGGHWVKMHAVCARNLKQWRLKGTPAAAPAAPAGGAEPLLGGAPRAAPWVFCCLQTFQWRDLAICAGVTVLNTVASACLPLLNGKPQPLLLSNLFDKTLVDTSDAWAIAPLGVFGTMLACLLLKWFMTMLALSMPTPGGVVAPTMVIGALIGRTFVLLIPGFIKDLLLTTADGSPVTPDIEGAFMARFAIVGAAAFCAAVCRAFAMAITVFEVLALPNAVLPLCCATLTAIFVANKVELPFFDKNLAGRGLGGIPALTFTNHADAPAFSIMRKLDVDTDCLCFKTRLYDMHELLKRHPQEEYFAVVRPLDAEEAVLVGSMARQAVDKVIGLLDPEGNSPETVVDLMDPELQRPADGGEPLVDGCPPHVLPSATVKEVYLVMKVTHGENFIYVTRDGCLLGKITFASLISHQP